MDEEIQEPPAWRFHILGPVVELSKLPVIFAHALEVVADGFLQIAHGIHHDVIAHHNYVRGQEWFRNQVSAQLESIQTTEE